jgi:serine/threonine protein kinase
MVSFRGLVGKSFRPPELHEQREYCATKVDSWCLGWSTFYLLTAQPLFMSADPAQQDSDWLLFQQGDFATLFQQKCNLCSPTGLDFIFRLLQIEPRRRMSIADALNHSWLADQSIAPVLAPKEVLAEMSMLNVNMAEVVDGYDGDQVQNDQRQSLSAVTDGGISAPGGTSYSPPTGKPLSGYGQSNELPTWASANPNAGNTMIFGGAPYGVPLQRARGEVRSPLRSPPRARILGMHTDILGFE